MENRNKRQLVNELENLQQRISKLKIPEHYLARVKDAFKYRTLFENLPQKIFYKDKDSTYVSCNENYARDLKINPEQITGKTDYDFYPKELAEKYRADDKRVMESGNTEDIEEKYVQDGKEGIVDTVKTPIKDENGNAIGILGIFWDITEHKQSEEVLRRAYNELEIRVKERTDELSKVNTYLKQEITEHKKATEAVERRDAILETASFAAERFLKIASWKENIQEILERIGNAVRVSRVYIFENHRDGNGILLTSQRYEWVAPGIEPQSDKDTVNSFPYREGGMSRWEDILQCGDVISGHVKEFPASEQAVLMPQGILAIVIVPIFVNQKWWGFIGLDECMVEREWYATEIHVLKVIANILGAAIQRSQAEEDLKYSFEKLRRILGETVSSLSSAVEKRDIYTAGHQQRVAKLSCAIAKEMGLSDEKIEGIRVAGLLHDIGKIRVPAEILNKPTKLDECEFQIVKTHSQVGFEILKEIEFPWPVAQIVLQHHERLNGSGYPQGLSGKGILLESKIVSVSDVIEAMSSYRPYRPAISIDKVLGEISRNRGILYSPEVVDICLNLFSEKKFKLEQDFTLL